MSDAVLRSLFGGWLFASFRSSDRLDRIGSPRDGETGVAASVESSNDAADTEVFAGLRRGDMAVLENLYRATYADLYRFSYSMVRSRDLAHEAVQEVFIALMLRGERLPTSGTIRGYLFVATRHRSLKLLRRDRRAEGIAQRAALEELPPGHGVPVPAADDQVAEDDQRSVIATVVRHLPERQRRALWLRMNARLGFSEIGGALGISADAARMLVNRAQAEVRRLLAGIVE